MSSLPMQRRPSQRSDEAPDPDRIRQARDDLLAQGVLARPEPTRAVPEVIERSWRRCVSEAVPTAPASIRYSSAVALDPRLREAAAPVLERLGEHLADVRVAMFLSNERGEIVLRRAHEPGQRTVLDRASAAEGFDFSEPSIGTNALGTVIQERRAVLVRGSEHYNDLLEGVTCAGTPIYEPFTRRILGSFSLACVAEDASPLMYAITTDVGRQIETNLTAMLGAREQALIRAYLVADQAGGEPVIVVNERTVFANTAGLPHLTPESHALLWTHLREAPPGRGPVRTRVPLQAGWRDVVVEPVGGGEGEGSAYCVRVLPAPAGGAGEGTTARRPRRAAEAAPVHPVPEVHSSVVTAARHGEVVALDGGPGTGKLRTALALLGARDDRPDPLVLDLATAAPGTGWFRTAADALDAGRAVVLRHLQDLAPEEVNRAKAIFERAAGAATVVGTVQLSAAPEPVRDLVAQVATVVELPPLRELRGQIPDLVAGMLAALPAEEARTRFSSDALQALLRWSWPGNLAELRRLVEFVARRHPGATVRAADLPAPLQRAATGRQLSMMENAERDAIVTALRRCDGNRRRAAEVLGIGRTTLYRKMQQHHIAV